MASFNIRYLTQRENSLTSTWASPPNNDDSLPSFVTWHTRRHTHEDTEGGRGGGIQASEAINEMNGMYAAGRYTCLFVSNGFVCYVFLNFRQSIIQRCNELSLCVAIFTNFGYNCRQLCDRGFDRCESFVLRVDSSEYFLKDGVHRDQSCGVQSKTHSMRDNSNHVIN